MEILIQLDGLLWRFGDVSPDAIAAVQDIQTLASRLEAANDNRSLQIQLYLAPGDRNVPEGDKLERLADRLGLEPQQLRNVEPFAALHSTPSDVILTSSDDLYSACRSNGLWAIRVGDHSPDGEMILPYADIRRGLEERLRIPTARPMRAGVRTGGLQSIYCASPDDAYELALDAIRHDRSADWLIVDSALVLYTEDADTDDRFGAMPNAERLSFGVNKLDLALSTGVASNDQVDLLQVGDFRLIQMDASANTRNLTEEFATWSEIRRCRLYSRARAPRTAKTETLPSMPKFEKEATARAAVLPAGDRIAQLRTTLSGSLEGNVTVDVAAGTSGPRAVSWTTNSECGPSVGISIWVYRSHIDTASCAVSVALNLSRWISSIANRAHVLHCLLLDERASIDSLLQRLLFEDERNRMTSVVEIEHLTETAVDIGISVQPSTIFRPAHVRIDAGDWTNLLPGSEQIRRLEAVLAHAIQGS